MECSRVRSERKDCQILVWILTGWDASSVTTHSVTQHLEAFKKMILLCLNPNTYLSLLFLISYCQPSSLPLPSTRTVQRWRHLHARCATPPTRKAALFVIQPRIAPRPAKGPTGRSTKSSANLSPHSLDAHHHHTNWHFFSPRPQKPQKLSG